MSDAYIIKDSQILNIDDSKKLWRFSISSLANEVFEASSIRFKTFIKRKQR